MGVLNKLMFWKKNDDFEFDKEFDNGLGGAGLPTAEDLGLDQKPLMNEKSPFDTPLQPNADPRYAPPPPPSTGNSSVGNRDLELIGSKLDTIKALLASLDQRVANLEKATQQPQKKQQQPLW